LFSAVISERFSKNCMIISVVAAKIWYLKNVWFLLGHPVVLTMKFSFVFVTVFSLTIILFSKQFGSIFSNYSETG